MTVQHESDIVIPSDMHVLYNVLQQNNLQWEPSMTILNISLLLSTGPLKDHLHVLILLSSVQCSTHLTTQHPPGSLLSPHYLLLIHTLSI